MSIFLNGTNITYYPVPKAACTSIKYMIYKLNYGKDFERYEENGVLKHIHNSAYSTPLFRDLNSNSFINRTRIAVIRDPISRMLSAFSNRVKHYGELSENVIDMDLAHKLGVQPNPSADHFFIHIEKFRLLSGAIRHHTDTTSAFLGPDLSYYHRIFPIEHLGDMVSFLEEATNQPIKLGQLQVGDQKVFFKDLGQTAQKSLLQYCYGDYALMRGYYSQSRHHR